MSKIHHTKSSSGVFVFLREEFFQNPLPMIDNEPQISLLVIHDKLTELDAQLKSQPEASPRIYDNKILMSLLYVKDRYIKCLRDNDFLEYFRHSDKYWYIPADVDRFLDRCHNVPFGHKS